MVASFKAMERSASYQMTEADVVAVARIAVKRNLSRPATMAVLLALYCTIILLLYLIAGPERAAPLLIAAVIAPPIAIWLILRFLLPLQAKAHFRQAKALQCETQVSWDETEVTLASELGTTRLAWSDFRQIIDRNGYFVLFQSDMLYNAVPQAPMGEERAEDFRRLAGLAP